MTEAQPYQSRRRSKAMFGCVNFPVNTVRSSGEGGMFVKLVVVDTKPYETSDWTICCGGAVYDQLSEQLIGDDQAPAPQLEISQVPEEMLRRLDEHEKAYRQWKERHFPRLYDESEGDQESRYSSRDYLAAMVLGTTGWSGYDDERECHWHCTYDDLTEQGKQLYQQVQALYPGCQLHLLTFLDT